MLAEQRAILSRDIPVELAILFAAVMAIAIGLAVWGYRTSGSRGESILRVTSAALCLLGLAVSGYIAYKALIVVEPIECRGDGGGCKTVEESRYARFLGIHMSIYGLIGYSAILAATVWWGDLARITVFGLSLFGFVISILLRYLELWQIGASCQWCVASAALMISLFVVNTCRVVGFYGTDELEPDLDAEEPDPDIETPA